MQLPYHQNNMLEKNIFSHQSSPSCRCSLLVQFSRLVYHLLANVVDSCEVVPDEQASTMSTSWFGNTDKVIDDPSENILYIKYMCCAVHLWRRWWCHHYPHSCLYQSVSLISSAVLNWLESFEKGTFPFFNFINPSKLFKGNTAATQCNSQCRHLLTWILFIWNIYYKSVFKL